ncbi:MAG: hypothetical protein WAV05_12520 [Anaerolineales bacterium]|jgi:hypothetical protein
MDKIYWIYSILSILAILCIIVGLWIAGKFLPACINWIEPIVNNDLLSQPFAKIILWLALGGLFSLPLLDLVRWLGNLANIVVVPSGQGDGGFSTSLGLIPSRVYLGFTLFLMLVLYGIVVWFAAAYLTTPGQFNQTNRIFIVLSIASLFYRGVYNIFTLIFSVQLPPGFIQQNYGVPGFLFEVAIGFVILVLILFGLNRFMPTHPPSGISSEH